MPHLSLCSQLFYLCCPLKDRNYSFHLLLLLKYFSENAEFPNTERYFSLWNFRDSYFCFHVTLYQKCLTDFLHVNGVLCANY